MQFSFEGRPQVATGTAVALPSPDGVEPLALKVQVGATSSGHWCDRAAAKTQQTPVVANANDFHLSELLKDDPVFAASELDRLDSIGAIRLRGGDRRLVEFAVGRLYLSDDVNSMTLSIHQRNLRSVHLEGVLTRL